MASKGWLVGGRYRLESVIGTGGMGIVWRAFDERLRRWVAVKEISFGQPMTARERDEVKHRAMAEARSAGRLFHPNIVAVYDAVDHADQPWIVMRHVEGRSLRQLVEQEGPLDPAAAARLGLGLLDALDAAHAAGVVHHDVKPSNVLVQADGRPLLTDFSIATVVGTHTPIRGAGMLGSPGYVAPERIHGAEGGAPADLFGLGATLFFAVEGAGPFDRATALACLVATACEPHPRPERAGPLTPVIDALLAKDEADRVDATGARAGLVAAARAGRPEPRPRRHAVHLWRRRTGRRWRVALVTATAALVFPVVAALASSVGGPGGGYGPPDVAMAWPPSPDAGPSTAEPGAARPLGQPDAPSRAGVAATPPASSRIRPIARTTDPTPGSSGGGGGAPTSSPTPSPARVTALAVAVSVGADCTFSAAASVTVSGATTVTYQVTRSDTGEVDVRSVTLDSAGSAALAVPENVPHGAGGVWVQVEILEPDAATERGAAELPPECSSTPTLEASATPAAGE